MAWVYILECHDETYYVGSTTNLERRVWQHQAGLGAEYTRHRMVWSASFERIEEAFAYEKQIQGWSRKKRQALVEGRVEDLSWLGSRSDAAIKRRR